MDQTKDTEKKGFFGNLKDKIMPGKKAEPVAAEKDGKSVLPVIDTMKSRDRKIKEALGETSDGGRMVEKDEYAGAWSDGEEPVKANPITESVVAARNAEGEEFRDAFTNDSYGIDVVAAAEKEEDQA